MEIKRHHGQVLFDAVMARKQEQVKTILKEGTDLDFVVRGDMAIHIAARNGDGDIIAALLNAGDDVNKGNQNGNTAMHFVARNGKEDLIQYLKDIGGDINYQNEDGDTPLHASVGYQPMDVVENYVKMGMNVNKQNKNGDTPLHRAVFHSRDESVEALLLCKANVDIQNYQGKYAYQLAKSGSISELVKTYSLLKSGYIMAQGTKFRHKDVGRPNYLSRVGITIETMSLDELNSCVLFYCRREKFENKSVEYEKEQEEEVISDVYHFRVRDVIGATKTTLSIPLYSEASSNQEIISYLITEDNKKQIIDEVKFVKKLCTIKLTLVPEETTAIVVCMRPKVQSEEVGETAVNITSELDDNFEIDIPEGAFEKDTKMSLKVYDFNLEDEDTETEDDSISTCSTESDIDEVEPESPVKKISSQANLKFNPRNLSQVFEDVTQIRKEKETLLSSIFQIDVNGHQPSKGVKLQIPLNEDCEELKASDLKILRINDNGQGNNIEVINGRLTMEGGNVVFETEHFSTFVACPIRCTDLSVVYTDMIDVKYRRQEARFFAMLQTMEDGITHVLMVECIKSKLSKKRRKHWRHKGFERQKPKHSSRIMLHPGQEMTVELSGDAIFDGKHGNTGHRKLVFSPHRASFQPYQVTLPAVYNDGKAAVHLCTTDTLDYVRPSNYGSDDGCFTGVNEGKCIISSLNIQLRLPPEVDPYGPEVEDTFFYQTAYEKQRRNIREQWLQMLNHVRCQHKKFIFQQNKEKQTRYVQRILRQASTEEERKLEKDQVERKRTLFPTDILASLFKRKGKK